MTLERRLRPFGIIAVGDVLAGSLAAVARLRPGDEILATNDVPVESDLSSVIDAISSLPAGGQIALRVRRADDELIVVLRRR